MSLDHHIGEATALPETPQSIEAELTQQEIAEELCWIDGFVTAIAIGPETIPPSEWATEIWGDPEQAFESAERAEVALGILLIGYSRILKQLRKAPVRYFPIFHDDHDRGTLATQWAQGFLAAMRLRWQSWRELIDAEEHRSMLVPILALLTDADGKRIVDLDRQAKELGVPPEQVTDTIAGYVAQSVRETYAYWQARSHDMFAPGVRAGPKIGRNEPCPCGSGKKYKKCCLN